MSDFSSGILIRPAHKEIALKYLEDDTYLIKLNDAWLCRLSGNDFCDMTEENYSEAVLNLSAHIPLMHIMSAEDHGFELGILHNKKLVFHFRVDYGVESEFASYIGSELYGNDYLKVMCDQEVIKRIQSEVQKHYHVIEERVESFFSGIGEDEVKQFGLFGFHQDDCTKIQNILTLSNYEKDEMGYQMIKELLAVLGLEEFSFVSYNYVNPDEGIFDVLS